MERLGIKKYNPQITQFNKMKAKIIFMATLAAAVLTVCNNDENNVIDTGSSQATFTADTRAQASQKTFDFLWSQQTGSKASPNVQFIFTHKMTKLVLTIRKGDGVSFQEVQDAVLSLRGFKYNGSFNVTDGTATATGDNLTADWTFAGNSTETGYNAPLSKDDAAETVAYTLILFPQVFSSPLPITAITGGQSFSATLDFTDANDDAGDTDAQNEWVAGRQYNLSVTLHKTDITVDGCTIQGWDEADGGNVNAD